MTTIHMSQSILGPLTNWKAKDWRNATKWISKKDGSKFTPEELRRAFLDHLAAGHKVIPIGECDNFDFKQGCMGHPEKEAA